MKKIGVILLIIGFCTHINSQAQVPEKIDFQAAARTASGDAIANQNIDVRITIILGPLPGTNEYIETHSTTTDAYGLFTLPIGTGNPQSGAFTNIDWGNGVYFTQVEIDPDGQGYINMGSMELMSVPYALFADYGADEDADPSNEFQTISESGNTITLSNGGGSVTDDVNDADYDPTNEIQDIFWEQDEDNIFYTDGKVGIGTSDPRGRLDVLSGSSPTDALYVKSSANVADQGGIIHYQSTSHPFAWQVVTKYNNSEDGALSFHFINNSNPSSIINPNVLALSNGNVGIGTDTPGSKLTVVGLTGTNTNSNLKYNSGTGAVYFQMDSKKNMKNINGYKYDVTGILQVEPKEYVDISNDERNIGYIAEDFDELGLKDLVIYDNSGEPEAIKYDRIPLYLVEIIKNQQKDIEDLKSRMAVMEKSK